MATLILVIAFLAFPHRANWLTCESANTPEGKVWSLINCYAPDFPEWRKKQVLETIRCESSFDTTAKGDGGDSNGLVQIHQPSWPDIPVEKAQDPIFSINFIISKFRQGQEELWTCWRNKYGQGNSQETHLAKQP